jgi:hypothetical protein
LYVKGQNLAISSNQFRQQKGIVSVAAGGVDDMVAAADKLADQKV